MAERFTIAIPDAQIADLQSRLRNWRPPAGVTTSGGLPLAQLEEVIRNWSAFDWRAHERILNELPHYRTEVVHFIHVEAQRRDALPLLLLHGWPGSFIEFRHVIPLLANDFHLVIPSLPGYGFSPLREEGYSNARIADAMAELMTALGYTRFGVQGGDWGAGIATWLAIRHPNRVVGMHLNYIPGSYAPPAAANTDEENEFLRLRDQWVAESGGYGHIQRTRPLTLGYALADSPTGLAAWIYEKFVEWADPETLPRLDDILLNVSIYWFTNTITSSMRLYLESPRTPLQLRERIETPTAILRCRLEAPFPPRSWIERGYHVRRWTDSPKGGHFAALEVPDVFADDVRSFFLSL